MKRVTRARVFTHILRAIVALILCRYAFIFLFFVFPVICRGERIHIKYVINPLPDVCVRIDGFVFSQDDWFLIEPREENIAQSQARLLPHEVSLHILHIYFLLSTNAFLTNIKTDSTRRLRSVRYFFFFNSNQPSYYADRLFRDFISFRFFFLFIIHFFTFRIYLLLTSRLPRGL